MSKATARLILVFAITLAIGLLISSPAHAQATLQAAKALYAAAAYDDALAALAQVEPAESRIEVDQYRAFCLIALGRMPAAEQAVAAVIRANPAFVAGALDVSPRIQEVFDRARKDLLPDITRELYGEAKAAYQRKERDAAVAGFSKVVALIAATQGDVREALDEYHFLAVGFLELSRSLPMASPSLPANGDAGIAESVADRSRPAPPVDVTPPVALRQALPAWLPPDAVSRIKTFSGAVRVTIDPAGKVATAELTKPIHPAYDGVLIAAAKRWEYRAATRNGSPVSAEQVVEIQLKPPR